MKPAPFDYLRPSTVDEVVAALSTEDAKLIAGGQSLAPLLNLRLARPSLLVDLNGVPGLDGIEADGDGTVHIGAMARHEALAEQTAHPLLAAAAAHIGHPAIRTRGTLGGSLAHADPAAELPAVALACGATVEATGPSGARRIPAEELFLGPFSTALAEDEVITAVELPAPRRWGFAEFSRRHGDFALVLVAVSDVDGEVRVAVGGVGPVPVLLDETAELSPTGDLHASADYRRALAGVLVRRALEQAG